jgi:hypothetical protein
VRNQAHASVGALHPDGEVGALGGAVRCFGSKRSAAAATSAAAVRADCAAGRNRRARSLCRTNRWTFENAGTADDSAESMGTSGSAFENCCADDSTEGMGTGGGCSADGMGTGGSGMGTCGSHGADGMGTGGSGGADSFNTSGGGVTNGIGGVADTIGGVPDGVDRGSEGGCERAATARAARHTQPNRGAQITQPSSGGVLDSSPSCARMDGAWLFCVRSHCLSWLASGSSPSSALPTLRLLATSWSSNCLVIEPRVRWRTSG